MPAALRALAGQPGLIVEFSDRSAHADPTCVRLCALPQHVTALDVSRIRGAADAEALRLCFSDAAIHLPHRPRGAIAGRLYDALEQVRVETLGMRRFPGCRENLAAHSGARFGGNAADRSADLAETIALLLAERLNGAPGRATHIDSIAKPEHLDHLIGRHLDQLVELVGQQEAFAKVVLDIVHVLELPEDPRIDSNTKPDAENGDAASTSSPSTTEAPTRSHAPPAKSGSPLAGAGDGLFTGEGVDDPAASSNAGMRQRFEHAFSWTNYRAYCTRFDEVVHASALCSAQELARLRAELDRKFEALQGTLPQLANRLQRTLLAKQQRWWTFDLEEGLLDSARLARVAASPIHPLSFKQEKTSDFPDTVVTLLIDNSGSMRGRPIALAAVSAELLSRALERCGVKVEILGFTTRNWKGGSSREEWIRNGKPAHPGRLNDLRHIIYKAADVPWRRARRNLGLMLREGLLKENIDGEALLWAHARLTARPEQRQILMVISDGAPADDATTSATRDDYLDQHLRAVVEWIERTSSIELLAIGIRHDVSRYYRRALTIGDPSELGIAMVTKLIELFQKNRRHIGCLLASLAMLGVAGAPIRSAQAQGFPTKAVRIVVPTTPGGGLDLIARLIALDLNKSWAHGVVVDNRAGAGGTIGVDLVAKANPDGHTIAFVATSFTTNASVYTRLPYDSLRDFAPVTLVAFMAWVLVVNPSLPVHSVKDLIALAKAKPGQINYASTGNGSAPHLAAELLKSMTGTNMVHIPYKGTVPAVTDVISGQAGLVVTGLAATMPHVTTGKLRALAVTGTNRSTVVPEIPTIGETVPGYEFNNWVGVLAPRATPNEIVVQLHGSIVRALQGKEIRRLLLAQSIEPVGSSSAQFGAIIRQEISKYSKLAKDIGVRIE